MSGHYTITSTTFLSGPNYNRIFHDFLPPNASWYVKCHSLSQWSGSFHTKYSSGDNDLTIEQFASCQFIQKTTSKHHQNFASGLKLQAPSHVHMQISDSEVPGLLPLWSALISASSVTQLFVPTEIEWRREHQTIIKQSEESNMKKKAI